MQGKQQAAPALVGQPGYCIGTFGLSCGQGWRWTSFLGVTNPTCSQHVEQPVMPSRGAVSLPHNARHSSEQHGATPLHRLYSFQQHIMFILRHAGRRAWPQHLPSYSSWLPLMMQATDITITRGHCNSTSMSATALVIRRLSVLPYPPATLCLCCPPPPLSCREVSLQRGRGTPT